MGDTKHLNTYPWVRNILSILCSLTCLVTLTANNFSPTPHLSGTQCQKNSHSCSPQKTSITDMLLGSITNATQKYMSKKMMTKESLFPTCYNHFEPTLTVDDEKLSQPVSVFSPTSRISFGPLNVSIHSLHTCIHLYPES